MLTMCWSWIFITIILLLVQPGSAFHNYQNTRNIIRSRNSARTAGLWLRALESLDAVNKKSTNVGAIVAGILVFLVFISAIGAFVWYRHRRRSSSSDESDILPGLEKISRWWADLRHQHQPTDIEKGEGPKRSRFSITRLKSKRSFGNLKGDPPTIIDKPDPPVLPHIPKYPNILERLTSPQSTFFPNASRPSDNSQQRSLQLPARVLVAPPPARRPALSGTTDRFQKTSKSPTEHLKDWFNKRPSPNPFVPLRDADLDLPLQDHDLLSNRDSPLDSVIQPVYTPKFDEAKPLSIEPSSKPKNPAHTERVKRLYLVVDEPNDRKYNEGEPLNSDYSKTESSRFPFKTKTTRTAKNLRFLLPSSPRSPLAPRTAGVGQPQRLGIDNGMRRLDSALAPHSAQDWRPPKTAYI